MRIDAYNHFFPKAYFQKIEEVASGHKDIGKRIRNIPAIHDLDARFRSMDSFSDYKQIISVALPPPEEFAPASMNEDLCKIANDGMAELCAKHPDRFCGFVAQAPLLAADAGARETERALKQLGAAGVQINTNVKGKPLDRPEFEPFFAAMNANKMPIWVHPTRTSSMPDYFDEQKSLYEIWWTFGWPYETSAFMARMVFSKMLDRYPDLKIITHHLGGMVPYFEGRVGPGWDQLGARTSDEDYVSLRKSLKKRPFDYFKEFYADTATFGSRPATECGIAFFGIDKVIFASDSPFDPEKGPAYIRETIKIIDALDISKADREKIYSGNIEKLTGKKFT